MKNLNVEEKIEKLAEKINSLIRVQEDHYTSKTDSPYVEALLYNESETCDSWEREISFDLLEKIEFLKINRKILEKILVDSSYPIFIGNIGKREREIRSICMGELEIEINDFEDDFLSLGEKNYAAIKGKIDGCMPTKFPPSYAYIDMSSCRWSLILDEEILAEKIDELTYEAKKSD